MDTIITSLAHSIPFSVNTTNFSSSPFFPTLSECEPLEESLQNEKKTFYINSTNVHSVDTFKQAEPFPIASILRKRAQMSKIRQDSIGDDYSLEYDIVLDEFFQRLKVRHEETETQLARNLAIICRSDPAGTPPPMHDSFVPNFSHVSSTTNQLAMLPENATFQTKHPSHNPPAKSLSLTGSINKTRVGETKFPTVKSLEDACMQTNCLYTREGLQRLNSNLLQLREESKTSAENCANLKIPEDNIKEEDLQIQDEIPLKMKVEHPNFDLIEQTNIWTKGASNLNAKNTLRETAVMPDKQLSQQSDYKNYDKCSHKVSMSTDDVCLQKFNSKVVEVSMNNLDSRLLLGDKNASNFKILKQIENKDIEEEAIQTGDATKKIVDECISSGIKEKRSREDVRKQNADVRRSLFTRAINQNKANSKSRKILNSAVRFQVDLKGLHPFFVGITVDEESGFLRVLHMKEVPLIPSDNSSQNSTESLLSGSLEQIHLLRLGSETLSESLACSVEDGVLFVRERSKPVEFLGFATSSEKSLPIVMEDEEHSIVTITFLAPKPFDVEPVTVRTIDDMLYIVGCSQDGEAGIESDGGFKMMMKLPSGTNTRSVEAWKSALGQIVVRGLMASNDRRMTCDF